MLDSELDISILLEEFIEDAASHLDAAESAFLDLEQRTAAGAFDDGELRAVLGNLHTRGMPG